MIYQKIKREEEEEKLYFRYVVPHLADDMEVTDDENCNCCDRRHTLQKSEIRKSQQSLTRKAYRKRAESV